MGKLSNIILLLYFVVVSRPAIGFENYRTEAYSIMKRMAEADQGFDEHDVARVHLVQEHGRQRRRLVKRNLDSAGDDRVGEEVGGVSILHLNLTSGSKMQLTLNPVALLSPDTVVSYQTREGRMVRKRPQLDCYSHGQMKDSSGEGWAAVSHCDGVFGFASTPEFEYFLHPIESKNFKEGGSGEDYDVHVMWKRSTRRRSKSRSSARRKKKKNSKSVSKTGKEKSEPQLQREVSEVTESKVNQTTQRFVIEMAMFSDAQYWQLLQELYPGREDDFLLTRLAAAQALYGDPDKVGYHVQIKLKLLEYWITNPTGYKFEDRLANNLRSFCQYTQDKYFYDIHALNTGIVAKPNGVVGLAYGRSACSQLRCFTTLAMRLNSFVIYAHEMGHTLGMKHFSPTKCAKYRSDIGGFMGGDTIMPFNFSPCMKHELTNFIKSHKSICLFTESGHANKLEQAGNNYPTILPGQMRQPDDLCHVLAGQGYRYERLEKPYRTSLCRAFFCLNVNESSPEFGRVRRFGTPLGLPCGDESLCLRKGTCVAWNQVPGLSGYLDALRKMKKQSVWSEWTTKFSRCSKSCGSGVRFRRRECLIKGFNLTPYCPGVAVQPELCNTDPCPEERLTIRSASIPETRLIRGREECLRILRERSHRSQGSQAKRLFSSSHDTDMVVEFIHRDSCITTCTTGPKRQRESFDVLLPDGTPCLEATRSQSDLRRFKIQMKCVQGLCVEFTDCPQKSQVKDECGVCGGSGSTCVHLRFNSTYDVAKGKRRSLATIPARSTDIYVRKERARHLSVILELWSHRNNSIIGSGRDSSEDSDKRINSIEFAGTRWVYTLNGALLRADGPIKEPVVIKVLRVDKPINEINLRYGRATEN